MEDFFEMKTIVMDLDNTISFTKNGDYSAAEVDIEVVAKMREYKEMGFKIVIHSARNMRTYDGNLGLINANTLPVVMRWLDENDIPYDEILMGKPWCGFDGFYVDDKAVRPNEFKELSYEKIKELIGSDT